MCEIEINGYTKSIVWVKETYGEGRALMKIKSGTMLYFAEIEYKHLQLLLEHYEGLEDVILVSLAQCVEKYMLKLLKEHTEEHMETHNRCGILNKLIPYYPALVSYRSLCRFLKDCYHERNYESEDYYEMEESELEEIIDESLHLIQFLRKRSFEDVR